MAKSSGAITQFYEAAKKKGAQLTQYKRKEREGRPLRRAGVALSALGAAGAGAYLDGRFDAGDGEGMTLGPVKITPVVGAVAVALGVMDAVPGAEFINGAGVGLLCSWAAGKGHNAGVEAANKK